KPDLAVADAGSADARGKWLGGGVSVLFGNGDGSFQTAVQYPVGGNPTAVAVADVNGDGQPDLVVAAFATYDPNTGYSQGGNGVSVLLNLNDGTGHFASPQTCAAGTAPRAVAVADVNGDRHPDLVVADFSATGGVRVLRGNG